MSAHTDGVDRPDAPVDRGTPTAVVASVGAAAVLAAVAIPPSVVGEGPVLCPFRLMTGLPCPGCGLTRSWVAAAHGELSTAFSDNLVGPLTLLATAVVVVATIVLRVTRPRRGWAVPRMVPRAVVYAAIGLWLVYGLARAADAAAGTGVFPAVA